MIVEGKRFPRGCPTGSMAAAGLTMALLICAVLILAAMPARRTDSSRLVRRRAVRPRWASTTHLLDGGIRAQ
jgi:hypothetical protein